MEIINQAQMDECMTGDPELDQDLIQCALEEIKSRISDMQASLSNQDYDGWKKQAHRSVGATATLGFIALADEFRNAEHHVENDNARTATLEKLKHLIELTQQELKLKGLL
jgi:HPt (histidine-containing phosphotransfer) domain-containing protein